MCKEGDHSSGGKLKDGGKDSKGAGLEDGGDLLLLLEKVGLCLGCGVFESAHRAIFVPNETF